MKPADEFLSSLKQRRLSYRAESALAGEEVETPAELLIPVTLGLLVFPVFGDSRHAATKAGIEIATSDLAQIGRWIRHNHGYPPLHWHLATGPVAGNGVVAQPCEALHRAQHGGDAPRRGVPLSRGRAFRPLD